MALECVFVLRLTQRVVGSECWCKGKQASVLVCVALMLLHDTQFPSRILFALLGIASWSATGKNQDRGFDVSGGSSCLSSTVQSLLDCPLENYLPVSDSKALVAQGLRCTYLSNQKY